jgi:hypothetical protein
VLSTVAASASHPSAGVSVQQALTNGFTVAFTAGAAITLLGAAIAFRFLARPASAQITPLTAGSDVKDAPEELAA